MQMPIIPYWIIILVGIIDILALYFDRNIDLSTARHRINRIRLTIIPKIYFMIIYVWFMLDITGSIPIEIKSLYGRNGIFAILTFDAYIHIANIVDFYWISINLFISKMKLKLLSYYYKFKK